MADENRIRDLANAAEELKRIQANCRHPSWTDLHYDPEPGGHSVPIPGEYEKMGSDIWPKTRWVEKSNPRWSQKCTVCFKKRYSYQRPK